MKGDRNGFLVKNRTTSITFARATGALLIGILAMLSLSGCTGSEKARFYMLDPLVRFASVSMNPDKVDISVGVAPISMPEYLNRPQIVTRFNRYGIDIADFDRWAEPLEASITSALAENLAVLLSTNKIYTYPWSKKTPMYELQIEILNFDGKIPGNVEFTARWTLLEDGRETRINRNKFTIRKPIAGQGYSGMVSAMSLVLYDFSREIAATVMTEALDDMSE